MRSAELLLHEMQVEIVPGLHDLAALPAADDHAAEFDRLARSGLIRPSDDDGGADGSLLPGAAALTVDSRPNIAFS